jgi:hypothetical protein
MKNQFIKILSLTLLTMATFSCKKEYDNNNLAPLAPSYADIPVTVTNPNFFERFPVITAKGNFTAPVPPSTTPVPAVPTAAAPGNFSITFSIPSDKGTIKSIKRVAVGANSLTTVQSGSDISQLNFNNSTTAPAATPLPGNGSNTITFNSSLFDYTTYRARVGTGAGAVATIGATPQAPTQLLYTFVLVLSTSQGEIEVIPTQVRVRVVE